MQFVNLLHVARRTCAQRSRYGEAKEIEMSQRFGGECNGCENESQGVASEFSLQAVPILGADPVYLEGGGNIEGDWAWLFIIKRTYYTHSRSLE